MKGTLADWERDRFHDEAADGIAELPETTEPYALVRETGPGEPVVLMERSCGGWRVELRLTVEGQVAVTVQPGEGSRLLAAIVPPEHALDAFHHPFCYLPR